MFWPSGLPWRTVWRAVQRHQSQVSVFEALKTLPEDTHETLWGEQTFYRVYSTVNGGRATETDLFEGLRESSRESDEE